MIGGGEARTIAGTYDWGRDYTVVTLPGGKTNSPVLLDDGRVLLAYTDSPNGTAIKLAYAADVAAFRTATFGPSTTFATAEYSTAQLFRSPSGGLFMAAMTMTRSGFGGDGVWHKRFYSSTDNGVSWSLYSSLPLHAGAVTGGVDSATAEATGMGIPYFDGSTWIVSCPNHRVTGGNTAHHFAVYRGTDNGTNWSGPFIDYDYGASRGGQANYVARYGSKFRLTSSGGGDNQWATSTDGSVWTQFGAGGAASGTGGPQTILTDSLGWYITNGEHVWRLTGDTMASATAVADRRIGISASIGPFFYSAVRLGPSDQEWFFIGKNKMWVPKDPDGGWVVGSIGPHWK